MRRSLGAALAGLALAGPAAGQVAAPLPPPASYLAAPSIEPGPEARVARKGAALAHYVLTPALAVELQDGLDPTIAAKAAVQPKFPFGPGRMLYGWRERPGLFCDLMRNRGLGSSTACLRDRDGDGRFDQAVRYDFNSGHADQVFITDKGKVRGGKFETAIALARPLAYRPAAAAPLPEARMQLLWQNKKVKDEAGHKRSVIELVVSDGPNFTGTEIFAEQDAQVPADQPVEVPFYGVTLRLAGLNADGLLSYTVAGAEPQVPMPLIFRGYTLRIMII